MQSVAQLGNKKSRLSHNDILWFVKISPLKALLLFETSRRRRFLKPNRLFSHVPFCRLTA